MEWMSATIMYFGDGLSQSRKEMYRAKYWTYIFQEIINRIVSILCDLTRFNRESDWLLHLSAWKRTLPLFFCYDRTNYARWGSLYYEDCLKLPTKFPEIYKEFQRGSLVVNFKKTCASAVPVDQALEKA